MQPKPTLVFACAHLTDERLFVHQVDVLSVLFDTRAVADTETLRQRRFADIAKVQAGGTECA